MLTKPAISDSRILDCLREEYGVHAVELMFLPVGADINTAVYRAAALDGCSYFVKLRKGDFSPVTVTIPHFLAGLGIRAIIPPIPNRDRQLWIGLPPYQLILYPFIEGVNGYQQELTEEQWHNFGSALRAIHSANPPVELAQQVPAETFTPVYRDQVRAFQVMAETMAFDDPVAAQLAQFLRAHQEPITRMVARGDQLGQELVRRAFEPVLCHSDMHAGNLLLSPDGSLHIVDWDNPTFSPRERDLILVGGSAVWNHPRHEISFYQGYGEVEINPKALLYYRYERIIQDIAAYCEQLLLSAEGGPDRERSLGFCTGQFSPGKEVDLAFRTEETLL